MQFLRPLLYLEVLLWASALLASIPSPVSVLRSYPGLLPQLLTACSHCLSYPTTSLSVCRQDNLTVGNSDHYTTLLKIPQDVTKLRTARSSFRVVSCQLWPECPYLPCSWPLTPLALYSATSHACLTPSPELGVSSAVSPPLIFSFSFASRVQTVSLQCAPT